MADVPVRLCCGQRHHGAVCPDGRVQCCLCFERVVRERLARDENGHRTDVCVDCEELERKGLADA